MPTAQCDRISQLEHALRSVLHDPLHQETAANATRILEETSPQPSIQWVERTSGFAGGMKKYWGCEIDGELLAVFLSGDEWFCVSAGLGITSEVALKATDLESAKAEGLQLLRRRSERILRSIGQASLDQSDSPTAAEAAEPSDPARWLEIPCRSEEEFDRHLLLDAAGLFSVKRSRETGQYQLSWREDNAVHTRWIPDLEYFARQAALYEREALNQRRLKTSGKPAT